MGWKFKFNAPKGKRLHRYFIGVDVNDNGTDFNLWCEDETGVWKERDKISGWYSSGSPESVRTFRAFKRYLRKHKELELPGITAILCNRFYKHGEYNFDIHARYE